VHTAARRWDRASSLVQAQIAGTELGVPDVAVLNGTRRWGRGVVTGSRQTYIPAAR